MGLGDMVAKATSSGSLKKIVQTEYTRSEVVPFLTPESWVRASGFAELCPREEVLCTRDRKERPKEFTADTVLTFLYGEAIHWGGQNRMFADLGVLRGKWSCLGCGKAYGGIPKGPLEDGLVSRPAKCECGNEDPEAFHYHELHFRDEALRIGGHPDGFLVIPGLQGVGILEMKTISPSGAFKIRNVPNYGHVIQVQIYMWLTGLKWAKIVYLDKGTYGLSGMIEHHIERDEDTIKAIKDQLKELWDGVKHGTLPGRICATSDCARAKECSVTEPCFA